MNTERPPKISIPIKRIERLIEMAKKHNLACLEIGHIKIIPEPKPLPMAPPYAPAAPTMRNGKALTPRQKEDAILFGMDGVTDE